jgi:ferrous iron transport protein A
MTLSDLPKGAQATVHRVLHPQQDKLIQLTALGFDPGEPVQVMMRAPFGDPIQIKVGTTLVSLHNSDAKYVELCDGTCKGHDQ